MRKRPAHIDTYRFTTAEEPSDEMLEYLMDEMMQRITERQRKSKTLDKRPNLIVIAGPNGSGKTSITQELRLHIWSENCVYINPDEIALNDFGDWNKPEFSLLAAKKAEALREKCLEERRDFIFETVFSASDKVDFISRAKAAGYFVRFFFISTENPNINAARITQRVKDGGHKVPLEKIISRYQKSIDNCSNIAKAVDRLYVYDNSVDFRAPLLLFRAGDGKLTKQYTPINPWAGGIFKAVQF